MNKTERIQQHARELLLAPPIFTIDGTCRVCEVVGFYCGHERAFQRGGLMPHISPDKWHAAINAALRSI